MESRRGNNSSGTVKASLNLRRFRQFQAEGKVCSWNEEGDQGGVDWSALEESTRRKKGGESRSLLLSWEGDGERVELQGKMRVSREQRGGWTSV